MINYALKYHHKLTEALLEHVEMVAVTLILSILFAAILTIIAIIWEKSSKIQINLFSAIYSIPSLAVFALLIPLTGLGKTTAILVLVVYNQYLLLRNFITGLNAIDASLLEAAAGMGMHPLQILYKIQLPLSKKALLTGIRLAMISTISIATIAASINAGGLGEILFDGLRTANLYKLAWGSILSASLAFCANSVLTLAEKKL